MYQDLQPVYTCWNGSEPGMRTGPMNGSAIVYTTQFVTRLMREHGTARHHVMRPPVLLMAYRVYSSTLSSTQAIALVQNFQQRVVGSIERRLSLLE